MNRLKCIFLTLAFSLSVALSGCSQGGPATQPKPTDEMYEKAKKIGEEMRQQRKDQAGSKKKN